MSRLDDEVDSVSLFVVVVIFVAALWWGYSTGTRYEKICHDKKMEYDIRGFCLDKSTGALVDPSTIEKNSAPQTSKESTK